MCRLCAKFYLNIPSTFLSYGCLNVATVVVLQLQNWHRFIFSSTFNRQKLHFYCSQHHEICRIYRVCHVLMAAELKTVICHQVWNTILQKFSLLKCQNLKMPIFLPSDYSQIHLHIIAINTDSFSMYGIVVES